MSWRAVVCALDATAMLRSRVSVYLHPLGGRAIIWHVLHALLDAAEPPAEVVVLHEHGDAVDLSEAFPDVRFEPVPPGDAAAATRRVLAAPGRAMLVDAAAPLLGAGSLARLLRGAERGPAAIEALSEPGRAVAVAGLGRDLAALEQPWAVGSAMLVDPLTRHEALRIADRHALSEASVALRDRLVRRHEAEGVTFLLPATTWVDVDVRIGVDTMVYPGCVLEGATTIGAECVIGPHSRLVECTIGRGSELKGWNYVSRIAIRNHAVLEAHERRALD